MLDGYDVLLRDGGIAHVRPLRPGDRGALHELADRAFRVPPVDAAAARELIDELRCAPLLHGYRGSPPADVAALAGQVARISRLLEDLPQVTELDLNPVIVTPQGAATVDVRIRVAPAPAPPSPLLRRLRAPSRA